MMTTTYTGQTRTAAETDEQLLQMRPKQTLGNKIFAFARAKPLGAVSAVILLFTVLAAVVSFVAPWVLPHDPLTFPTISSCSLH